MRSRTFGAAAFGTLCLLVPFCPGIQVSAEVDNLWHDGGSRAGHSGERDRLVPGLASTRLEGSFQEPDNSPQDQADERQRNSDTARWSQPARWRKRIGFLSSRSPVSPVFLLAAVASVVWSVFLFGRRGGALRECLRSPDRCPEVLQRDVLTVTGDDKKSAEKRLRGRDSFPGISAPVLVLGLVLVLVALGSAVPVTSPASAGERVTERTTVTNDGQKATSTSPPVTIWTSTSVISTEPQTQIPGNTFTTTGSTTPAGTSTTTEAAPTTAGTSTTTEEEPTTAGTSTPTGAAPTTAGTSTPTGAALTTAGTSTPTGAALTTAGTSTPTGAALTTAESARKTTGPAAFADGASTPGERYALKESGGVSGTGFGVTTDGQVTREVGTTEDEIDEFYSEAELPQAAIKVEVGKGWKDEQKRLKQGTKKINVKIRDSTVTIHLSKDIERVLQRRVLRKLITMLEEHPPKYVKESKYEVFWGDKTKGIALFSSIIDNINVSVYVPKVAAAALGEDPVADEDMYNLLHVALYASLTGKIPKEKYPIAPEGFRGLWYEDLETVAPPPPLPTLSVYQELMKSVFGPKKQRQKNWWWPSWLD